MATISLLSVIYILLVHYFADFRLQSDWMATNKSTNLKALLAHTGTYTLTLFVALSLLTGHVLGVAWFAGITGIFHTLQDAVTSRMTTAQWFVKIVRPEPDGLHLVEFTEDRHEFFATIGMDQLFHYLQMFILWALLTHYGYL